VGGRSPFAFVLVVILDLRGLWGVAEWGASIFFFQVGRTAAGGVEFLVFSPTPVAIMDD
jgi:hypothetical protein